jgi:geranylgeranyl pyrophosphate synthase
MVAQYDSSAEEVGRALSDVLRAARLLPDLADIWRAFGERGVRNRLRARAPLDERHDATALTIRANAMLIDAGMRMGLSWQRLVTSRLPAIRERLDDYRVEGDPLPETRNALLDEVAIFFNELAEFAADQGRALQQDIMRFQGQLLPDPSDKTPGPLPRRKRFSAQTDARLLNSDPPLKELLNLTSEMDRLEAAIIHWRTNADPHVRDMLAHQFDCDAKYFRPLTVFACFRAACGWDIPDSLVTSAQAVEMMHNASLIIDDIVDGSSTRRGKPTLHDCSDPLTAYMVAGYIVADAYDIIAKQIVDDRRDRATRQPEPTPPLPEDELTRGSRFLKDYYCADPPGTTPGGCDPLLDVVGPVRFDIRLLSELIKRLAVAECVQWQARKQPGGLADWYWLAREDTGSMFEICACIGARDQRYRRFGRLLGMLYHGCDDLSDLLELKKLCGGGDEDLVEGILTLPAALAIRKEEIRQLFCYGNRKDPKVLEKLRCAFIAEEEHAHEQLDHIAALAKAEAEGLNSCAPDILVDLVCHTRRLAPRTKPSKVAE